MTTALLREHTQHAELSKVADNLFEVTLITEGKGSSGTYSKELLREFGPATFGENVPNFFNHVGFWEDPSDRDIRTAAAKIVESWYTDEGGEGKVKAKIEVYKDHVDFVEFFMKSFGMSIFAEGTAEFDEATGELMVKSFNTADPYRSVDFVVAPGARGSIDKKIKESAPAEKQAKILESMRFFESQASNKPSTASVVEETTKGTVMDKDIEERFAKLETLLTNAIESKTVQVQAEADASAVDAEVAKRVESIKGSVAAVEAVKADLLPSLYTSLTERAYTGKDIAVDIEQAKVITKEARTEVAPAADVHEETGRLGESANVETYVFRSFGEVK